MHNGNVILTTITFVFYDHNVFGFRQTQPHAFNKLLLLSNANIYFNSIYGGDCIALQYIFPSRHNDSI